MDSNQLVATTINGSTNVTFGEVAGQLCDKIICVETKPILSSLTQPTRNLRKSLVVLVFSFVTSAGCQAVELIYGMNL